MPATFDVARDELLGLFKTAWDANTPAVTGGAIPVVKYEGTKQGGGEGPHDAPWARPTIRHGLGEQSALTSSSNKQRFEKFGIVTVQIFAPRESGGGLGLVEELAKVAKNAYEGKRTASGVWLQNVRINEKGEVGPWNQMDVVGEFRYDEFS